MNVSRMFHISAKCDIVRLGAVKCFGSNCRSPCSLEAFQFALFVLSSTIIRKQIYNLFVLTIINNGIR